MLTIDDVARRLHIPAETVHRWVRQGKIPMTRSGDTYSIRSEMLERWAADHNMEITCENAEVCQPNGTAGTFDSVSEAMRRGGLFYDVPATDRDSALIAAVNRLPGIAEAEKATVLESLQEREQLSSTGIGNGIALPHPRSNPGISLSIPQITTCFLSTPIAFEAIDRQPVSVLMVLLSDSTKQHLAMLSKLSFFLRDPAFRQCLLNQSDETAIHAQIEAMEADQ